MSRLRNPFMLAAIVLLLALAALPSSVSAQLAPGGTVYNPAVVPPFSPKYSAGGVPAGPTGYTLLTSTPFAYNYTGASNEAYFGTVTSSVYDKNDLSGRLAFSYVFNNLVAPPTLLNPTPTNTEITRVTIDDPTHPWTGVGILNEGSDSSGSSTPVTGGAFGSWPNGNPFDIARDLVNNGINANLNLANSGTELDSGTAATPRNNVSALIWFATDATRYRITNVGLADSTTVGTSEAYAPFAAPEPSTLLLAGMGVGAVFVLCRRHRGATVNR